MSDTSKKNTSRAIKSDLVLTTTALLIVALIPILTIVMYKSNLTSYQFDNFVQQYSLGMVLGAKEYTLDKSKSDFPLDPRLDFVQRTYVTEKISGWVKEIDVENNSITIQKSSKSPVTTGLIIDEQTELVMQCDFEGRGEYLTADIDTRCNLDEIEEFEISNSPIRIEEIVPGDLVDLSQSKEIDLDGTTKLLHTNYIYVRY